MAGLDVLIGALEAQGHEPREFNGQWTAKCPAHDSRGRKLGVKVDGDTVLFQCFAGCLKDDILGSLGLSWRDIFTDTGFQPTPRKEPWEKHLDAALRYGCKPTWVGNGVYSGSCRCGNELYVGRAGAVCAGGCQISLDAVDVRWESPVELARAFGCEDLTPQGQGVFVGSCPSCKGWLSAGPGGAFCESNCPVERVGSVARAVRDPKEVTMEQRTLNVLGCVEKKRGEKNGRQWVLYTVHANDEQGNPIQQELVSFSEIPQGLGQYWVEVRESQFGTQYTIKQPNALQLAVEDLKKRVAALEAKNSPVPPATAAAQSATTGTPVQFTPKVVESEGVPF
jgi:hypothetical protein